MEHRYSLTKKGKTTCPKCGQKTFVLYIENATGKPLHPTVGKCDRTDKCRYHRTPMQYFSDNNISFDKEKSLHTSKPAPKLKPQPSCIDSKIFTASLAEYESNMLAQYLYNIVGFDAANEAIGRYFMGTSKHWDGATVFWQIDVANRVRAGKIMQYDNQTGKRVKEPVNKISWVHTALRIQDFNLSQCFFDEHLLREYPTKRVAIVESEKTAIIASVYLPDMVWLACGGSEGLSTEKCSVLIGRNVTLYPDAGKLGAWRERAKTLSTICTISVSSLIEEQATDVERRNGFDWADYLVRFKPSDFSRKKQGEPATALQSEKATVVTPMTAENSADIATVSKIENATNPIAQRWAVNTIFDKAPKSNTWDEEIAALEDFYRNASIPLGTVLSSGETIINPKLFIENHLSVVKANNGKRTFLPYLSRLQTLKHLLTAN